jgi:hypothetical protein
MRDELRRITKNSAHQYGSVSGIPARIRPRSVLLDWIDRHLPQQPSTQGHLLSETLLSKTDGGTMDEVRVERQFGCLSLSKIVGGAAVRLTASLTAD